MFERNILYNCGITFLCFKVMEVMLVQLVLWQLKLVQIGF